MIGQNARQHDGNAPPRTDLVAVTGATGFVGSHLVEHLLQEGYAVRAIVRPTSDTRWLASRDVPWRVVDWEVPASLVRAVEGCRYVFHLAAVTAAPRRSDYERANTTYCAHLAQALLACTPPPVLVLCSSIAAAGPARRSCRLSDPAPAPVSHYGRSKRGGELAAALQADRLAVTIVRPGIVFGPRGRELLPLFRSIYRFRLHFAPTLRPVPLSWIHVADVAAILLRAATRGRRLVPGSRTGADPGFYYAVARESVDYPTFGRLVGRALGRPCLALNVPQPVGWLAAAAADGWAAWRRTTLPLSVDKMREASCGPWTFDPSALSDELDYTFPKTLYERIEETARWYLESGWL